MSNRGGARLNAGRKRGIGITYTIRKECDFLIRNLLKDEIIKNKIIKEVKDFDKEIKEDYFYIIKSNDKYKFGYSSNFQKRLKNYKTHNIDIKVLTLLKSKNCFNIESLMIDKYSSNRIENSEWFLFNNYEIIDVLDFINTINFR